MTRVLSIGVAFLTALAVAELSFAERAAQAVVEATATVPAPEPSAPVIPGAVEAVPAAAQDAAAAPAAKPSPLEPQGYVYEPGGRRDPFVSLVRRGEDSASVPPGSRPSGLAGLATSEVALRGTMQGRDRGWVAIVQGVDKKSYLAKAGDKLFDGTVRSVTPDSMVILQTVNDPLRLETQREVRKVLRQTEEAK